MSAAGRARDQTAGWVREQLAYVYGMYAYAYGFPLVIMDCRRNNQGVEPSQDHDRINRPPGPGHRPGRDRAQISAGGEHWSYHQPRVSCRSRGAAVARPPRRGEADDQRDPYRIYHSSRAMLGQRLA